MSVNLYSAPINSDTDEYYSEEVTGFIKKLLVNSLHLNAI